MSKESFASRMISTDRNIRHRCKLKYSKRGLLSWDKWVEYDCIFATNFDSNGNQHNRLELHSKRNIRDPSGKVIDLTKLYSVTSLHGNPNKNDPNDVIMLQINTKKHRFGFDNPFEYHQLKSLLDGVYNAARNSTEQHDPDENATVNMLYDSVTAMRYPVYFANRETQELLALPGSVCELVIDDDKIVLEQRNDKQYTFPRSTIHSMRLVNDNIVEFDLGSRAPVKGFISFRFQSPMDARACATKWSEGAAIIETTNRNPRGRSTRENDMYEPQVQPPQRAPLKSQSSIEANPQRAPPRSVSTKTPKYNDEPLVYTTTNGAFGGCKSFQTLV